MLFADGEVGVEAVRKVLEKESHTINNKNVDVKKAIPHAVHQVSVAKGASSRIVPRGHANL